MVILTGSEARRHIRTLLDDTSVVEAPIAYYALFHPLEKSVIFACHDAENRLQGFVGRFQTGADLFRPIVVLKCRTPEVAAQLLSQALVVGRPYILFTSLNQLSMAGGSLKVENERILRIYTVDPARFKPEINVMVEPLVAPDGLPRCVVRISGQDMASAGLNWKSPGFAEIYVQTDPQTRRRGWGKSVVACLTARLLKDGIRPLYLAENGNDGSRSLIESLGFYDTGSRHIYADTVYIGSPLA